MTQRGQWTFVLIIVGLLAGALFAGMILTPALEPVSVESEAPNFAAVNLATRDTVGLDDYRGKVMLLNIWATWCGPCVQEMPSMQRLYEELGPQGLAVIAVSVDHVDSDEVQRWIEDRGFTFDALHDQSAEIERVYQTTGVPESFVIDRDGVIVKKVIGAAQWDHPTQIALIRRLLGNDEQGLENDGS